MKRNWPKSVIILTLASSGHAALITRNKRSFLDALLSLFSKALAVKHFARELHLRKKKEQTQVARAQKHFCKFVKKKKIQMLRLQSKILFFFLQNKHERASRKLTNRVAEMQLAETVRRFYASGTHIAVLTPPHTPRPAHASISCCPQKRERTT